MARLPYVERAESPDVDELYTRIAGLGRPVLNLYRILANQPAALAAFLDTSAYVRSSSPLDPALRELVILATAHALGDEYEIALHTDLALRAGVPAAKLDAVAGGPLDALAPDERCAVEMAGQAARSRTCDDATFAALRKHFSDAEIVDLVMTAAWYHLCAVILGTLRVDLEAPAS